MFCAVFDFVNGKYLLKSNDIMICLCEMDGSDENRKSAFKNIQFVVMHFHIELVFAKYLINTSRSRFCNLIFIFLHECI